MPVPESATSMRKPFSVVPSVGSSLILTPPECVNLMALLKINATARCNRVASPVIVDGPRISTVTLRFCYIAENNWLESVGGS